LDSDAKPERQAGAGFLRLWPSQVTKQPIDSGLPQYRALGSVQAAATAGSD
jgi:hypothetical protein